MKFIGGMGLFVGTDAERQAYTAADVGQAWYSIDDLDLQFWNGVGWDAAIPDDAVTAAKIDPTAAWGASSKKLLNFVPLTSTGYLWAHAGLTDDSDFVATIATLPGGAVLTYNNPTSGAETCIVPLNATVLGKLVLHNTTRGDSALIDTVVIGTNTITLTANVPGTWQVGDTITARSQTNLQVQGTSRYFDLDMSGTLPPTATAVVFQASHYDLNANQDLFIHQYAAYSDAKQHLLKTQTGFLAFPREVLLEVVSQRLTFCWTTGGAGTGKPSFKIFGYFEEAAT